MTDEQLRRYALREAEQAGLDDDTADAVMHSVLARAQDDDDSDAMAALRSDAAWTKWIHGVIREEIQKHAAP